MDKESPIKSYCWNSGEWSQAATGELKGPGKRAGDGRKHKYLLLYFLSIEFCEEASMKNPGSVVPQLN